ncbi:Bacteriophytochrome cph2 [Blastochloris viridis]|uniref:Bacteriophytochrome cph2 n=1 Tax=Blastochloris viridis TaxID=1079 RepID=A0A0S4Q6F2_BLAVI|nr:Bacteriophytochrome cph2 [Blastochloris viridis]
MVEMLASLGQALYVWDLGSDTLQWSAGADHVLGVRDRDRIDTGRRFAELVAPATAVSRFDMVARSGTAAPGSKVAFCVEYGFFPEGPSGASVWLEDSGRWLAGADGRPVRVSGIVRVVTARHEREQDLTFRSRFDPLTGEMNRARLAEVVEEGLETAHKYRSSIGFLLAAIDNLAVINNAYGFDVADDVIAAVARRLRSRLRGGDAIGRFSGNKFGILIHNCSAEDLDVAARRLIEAMRSDVVHTKAGPVAVTISLGGVVAPRHARSTPEIFLRAQETLDAAKLRRRGAFVAYVPSVEREGQRRANALITDEIVGALNQRRVSLAFQPIVATTSRDVAFLEALMRVRGADGTLLDGAQVVPVAERLGLVRLIDHRVLELALAELAERPEVRLSINVSPSSTLDREWCDLLSAGLRRAPEMGRRLIVEITESAAIRDVDATRAFVTRVRDLGCLAAIDDFGAGYTSFRNLRELAVDMVKIDGGFVARMQASRDDRAFVETLVRLARQMDLKAVAEWVQDEATAAALAEIGCDYLQGSLFGMPQERAAPAVHGAA